jgi:uncharacterized membrane protein
LYLQITRTESFKCRQILFPQMPKMILIIPILGIVSFCIPLLLSSKYNLGTKLSRGEVRKSIVISLTVMYILLLTLSFYYTPTEAIGNFTQNFLYVYVIIIGFYFGSRLGERIKMLKELKNFKPLDILQKRYAMGEIDQKFFNNTKSDLENLDGDEKKEFEFQREVELLRELVREEKMSYDYYQSKVSKLKEQYGRNNPKNEKK